MNELETLQAAYEDAKAKWMALQSEGQAFVDLRRMSADELGRFEIRRAALPRLIEQAEIETLRADYDYQEALYRSLVDAVSQARERCGAIETKIRDADRELRVEHTIAGRLESQMLGARHRRTQARRKLETLSAAQVIQPAQQPTGSSNTETSFNVRLPLMYS